MAGQEVTLTVEIVPIHNGDTATSGDLVTMRVLPFPGDTLTLAGDFTVRVIRRTFFAPVGEHGTGEVDARLYVRLVED